MARGCVSVYGENTWNPKDFDLKRENFVRKKKCAGGLFDGFALIVLVSGEDNTNANWIKCKEKK